EVVTSSNVRKSSGRSGSSTLSSCPTLLSGMVYTTESVLDRQYTGIVLAFGSLFTNKSSSLLSPGLILTSSILDRLVIFPLFGYSLWRSFILSPEDSIAKAPLHSHAIYLVIIVLLFVAFIF